MAPDINCLNNKISNLKHGIFLIVCLFSFVSLGQQRQIDSLQKVVETAKSDTVKINALFEWSDLIYEIDPRKDIELNQRIIQICKKHGAEKNARLSRYYLDAMAEAHHYCGNDYQTIGDFGKSIENHNKYYQIRKKMFARFKSRQDELNVALALLTLSGPHLSQAPKGALDFLRESLKIQLRLKDSTKLAETYIGMGVANYRGSEDSSPKEKEKMLNEAFRFYHKGLKVATATRQDVSQLDATMQLANLYSHVNQLDSALYYFKQSKIKAEMLGDVFSIIFIGDGLARVQMKQGKYQEAISNASEVYHMSKEYDDRISENKLLWTLYSLWKKVGNETKSLFYLEQHDSLKTLINDDQTSQKLIEQRVRLENQSKLDSLAQQKVLDSLSLMDAYRKANSERELRKKNGQLITLLIIGVVLLSAVVFFVVSRIYRVRRQRRKLVKEYKELKEYTENASHELQTPLAVVFSKLDTLMQESTLSVKNREYLQSIYKETYRLSSLNKSLFLLSKIENDQFPSNEWVNLDELLKESVDNLDELISSKQLALKVHMNAKVRTKANEFLATTIISNLLRNSIRHNHPGGYIKVKMEQDFFFIENSGKELNQDPSGMFARFKKSSDSPDSSGLGLSIVKKACDSLGWEVEYIHKLKMHRLVIRFM